MSENNEKASITLNYEWFMKWKTVQQYEIECCKSQGDDIFLTEAKTMTM